MVHYLVFATIALLFARRAVCQGCFDEWPTHVCRQYSRQNACFSLGSKCQKSCGFCQDAPQSSLPFPAIPVVLGPCQDSLDATFCEDIERHSLCERFAEHCQATCGYCDELVLDSRLYADSTPCNDNNPSCPALKAAGHCENYENVRETCPFSCNLCIADELSVNVVTTTERQSEWGAFGPCSVTCGYGTMTRERACTGVFCVGDIEVEDQSCFVQACPTVHIVPAAGIWSDWGFFGPCSATCGNGIKTRLRECISGTCDGASVEELNCFVQACRTTSPPPIETTTTGRWSNWGYFGQCSETCGSATRTRRRYCIGTNCLGSPTEERQCFLATCPTTSPPGRWSYWGNFEPCSVTCGDGVMRRNRQCLGGSCQGPSFEERTCSRPACPTDQPECVDTGSSCQMLSIAPLLCRVVHDSETLCQKTCGGCSGVSPKDQPTKPIGTWGPWIFSVSCSRTCGGGTRTSTRTCTGGSCEGDSSKKEDCNTQPCIGSWGPWRTLRPCTKTCGAGTLRKTRTCRGVSCIGSATTTERCNTDPCRGTWGSWIVSGSCSRTCGGGTRAFTRTCTGGSCEGGNSKREECNTQSCIGSWGPWSTLRPCTKTCGGGTLRKTRTCKGVSCIGSATTTERCNTDLCRGSWDRWIPTGSCSKSCGVGNQRYKRKCIGGKCDGSSTKLEDCNTQLCLGVWGAWKEVGKCSRTCGTGNQKKTRVCNGNRCVGSSTVTVKCNTNNCPVTLDITGGCTFTPAGARILGGNKEDIKNSPWMVFIESSGHGCGGTLIGTEWVLTAAHCVASGKVSVFAGLRTLYERNCPHTQYDVTEKHVHPEYKGLINDLALLKLDRPIKDAPTTAPLKLRAGQSVPIGSKCSVTGWGLTGPGQRGPSESLMKVVIDILDPDVCKKAYGDDPSVGDFVKNSGKLICAGSLSGERDICDGDSGGPLTCTKNGRNFIIGITSFGPRKGCGQPGKPGMFADVEKYNVWIRKIIRR